jgi:hypothetical protein
MLFVLVMEVLNALIHEADWRAIFSPLPERIKHRASVYADDLVIFLSPDGSDFHQHAPHLGLVRGRVRTRRECRQVRHHTYLVLTAVD